LRTECGCLSVDRANPIPVFFKGHAPPFTLGRDETKPDSPFNGFLTMAFEILTYEPSRPYQSVFCAYRGSQGVGYRIVG
jgi:hypothetical protein